MSPLKFVGFLVVAITAFLAVTIYGPRLMEGIGDAPPRVGITVPTPEEDEPGFDCRIHGNKVCGPQGPVQAQ